MDFAAAWRVISKKACVMGTVWIQLTVKIVLVYQEQRRCLVGCRLLLGGTGLIDVVLWLWGRDGLESSQQVCSMQRIRLLVVLCSVKVVEHLFGSICVDSECSTQGAVADLLLSG